jgi:hypothetical protein
LTLAADRGCLASVADAKQRKSQCPRKLSANFCRANVSITKADEEPLTIQAEKKHESIPNI